jgi:hypothetical protein
MTPINPFWDDERLRAEMPDHPVGRVGKLVERVKPILAGQHPAVIGAAIADLLAILAASTAPDRREAFLAMHMAKVRELIPVNEAEIKRVYGPDPWGEVKP